MAMRLRTRRWTSSRTASPGSETSSMARASGRAAAMSCGDCGKTFCSHQRATSGNDSRRSVSPVGAQSTITQPKRPSSWWRLICSRLKSSSRPGGTVSSSALMRSTPRSSSSSPSQSWTAGPVALHLVLRGDLLGPQALADLRRLAADGGLQRVGQRVRRVGREHDGVEPARGDAPRGGGGDRGLADPALAGVEDRPGRHGRRVSLLSAPGPRSARRRRRRCPPRSTARRRTSRPPRWRGRMAKAWRP